MTMMTMEEYRESLRRLHLAVYRFGKRTEFWEQRLGGLSDRIYAWRGITAGPKNHDFASSKRAREAKAAKKVCVIP